MSKNAGVAGYVKAFWHVLSESQTGQCINYLLFAVLEEKEQKVKDLRPIDDVFFEVLADDIGFCQEMLRIILGDDKLVVIDVIVQSSERNLYGRSVRLDVLCTLGNGKKCSEFMECFLEKEVNNPKFPKLTDRMYYLKHQRGGLNAMCDVMEKYERKAVGEANVRAIKYMITPHSMHQKNKF